MRRWRRPAIEEELEGFDFDDDEEEEEEEVQRRVYVPPRPLRVTRFSDFDDDEGGIEDDIARFNKIQGLIRAGKYKPKLSDPYTAHVLYNNLKELGEI